MPARALPRPPAKRQSNCAASVVTTTPKRVRARTRIVSRASSMYDDLDEGRLRVRSDVAGRIYGRKGQALPAGTHRATVDAAVPVDRAGSGTEPRPHALDAVDVEEGVRRLAHAVADAHAIVASVAVRRERRGPCGDESDLRPRQSRRPSDCGARTSAGPERSGPAAGRCLPGRVRRRRRGRPSSSRIAPPAPARRRPAGGRRRRRRRRSTA